MCWFIFWISLNNLNFCLKKIKQIVVSHFNPHLIKTFLKTSKTFLNDTGTSRITEVTRERWSDCINKSSWNSAGRLRFQNLTKIKTWWSCWHDNFCFRDLCLEDLPTYKNNILLKKNEPASLMHKNIWSTTIDTRDIPAASTDPCRNSTCNGEEGYFGEEKQWTQTSKRRTHKEDNLLSL